MIKNVKIGTTDSVSGGIIGIITLLLLFCSAAPILSSAEEGEESKKMTGRNRLKDEKSPYLLQHADNPVDWSREYLLCKDP